MTPVAPQADCRHDQLLAALDGISDQNAEQHKHNKQMMAKLGHLETQMAAEGAKVPAELAESSGTALQDLYGLVTQITNEPAVGETSLVR